LGTLFLRNSDSQKATQRGVRRKNELGENEEEMVAARGESVALNLKSTYSEQLLKSYS